MSYRRIYAVPDIHGRKDLLDLLLVKLKDDGYDNTQDILIFLADMIDRGPDSCGVIQLVKSLCDGSNNVLALYGNHEDFAVKYHIDKSFTNYYAWTMNGGDKTLASYPNNAGSSHFPSEMSEDHIKWLGSLPRSLQIQGFFFSHAPVPKERDKKYKEIGNYSENELIWFYQPPIYFKDHEGPKDLEGNSYIGVCGHIHGGPNRLEPLIYKNYRLLDTGCGCFPNHPLIAHECIENRTVYAKAMEL